ncbi:MAG: MBL fold metallo-hydrolase, partial [Bacillota bacterium]
MKIKMHDLGNYMVRNYILETPRGFIAIDTGYPGGCEKFVFRFQKTAPLNALKYVFLTHAHDDHAGFLSDLLKQCEAKVVLNPLALPILAKGGNPVNPGAGYSSRVAALFGIF